MQDEEIYDYLCDRCFPPLWDASFQQALCTEILQRDERFILETLQLIDYRFEHAHDGRSYDARWSTLTEDLGEELASQHAGTERGQRLLLHVCEMSLRRERSLPFDSRKKHKYLSFLGARAIDLLIGLLERFPMNWDILDGLKNFSDPRVTRILVEKLAVSTDNAYVRCGLIEHIAQRPDVADRFTRIAACATDQSEDVRLRALETLNALDVERAAGFLREALSDSSRRVRVRALQIVAATKDLEATIYVANCLVPDQPVDVRVYAARTLGYLRPSAVPQQLIVALKDPASQVRGMSAWALGEIGDPHTLDALIQSQNDACELTAWSMRTAIAQMKAG